MRLKQRFFGTVFTVSLFLLTCALPSRAQQKDDPSSGTKLPVSPEEIQALVQSVHDLQARVDTLTVKVSEMQSAEERDHAETERLLRRPEGRTDGAGFTLLTSVPGAPTNLVSSEVALAPNVPQEENLETRVENLEENQQLSEARLKEQNQTKVESGSKYRLRLSGIVLVNLYANRGVVDNQDFPEIATNKQPIDSSSAFGGSLRQSQITLEGFGPTVVGAHTSANISLDFAGGFPSAPNSVSMGIVRLRTGAVRFEWSKTSLIIGQDSLFFAPRSPTSLSSIAVPALSYSGNLWSWTPQLRIEHRTTLSDTSSLLIQGGILDSFSGEAARSNFSRSPTWGEESGSPAIALRTAWSQRVLGETITFGTAGYYSRQYWGFGRDVDSWAGLVDWSLPVGPRYEFSGAFYRGRALGGLGGAIGQDLLLSGSFTAPTTRVFGLDSMGGWAQLKFRPWENFQLNGALGLDSPFSGELRRFPASEAFYHNSTLYSSYGSLLSRNLTPLVNFIYQPKSDVSLSVEYRRILTSELDSTPYRANHVSLNVGYTF